MKTYPRLACWSFFLVTLITFRVWADEVATVNGNNINVRGQPSILSEVITQLQHGDKVIILEEIYVENPAAGGPEDWVRIQMPANTPIWVSASYIDPSEKKVTASRLNLRAGPGENYSVLGRIERGTPVKEIRSVDGWMEIEPPASAYAFMAAEFADKSGQEIAIAAADPAEEDSAPTADRAETEEPPSRSESEEAAVAEPETENIQETEKSPPPTAEEAEKPGELEPAEKPVIETSAKESDESSGPVVLEETPVEPGNEEVQAQEEADETSDEAEAVAQVDSPAAPPVQAEPQRRIVHREGIVRSTISIQAPTYFELISPETRKTINYLHSSIPGLNLRDFRGRKVLVSGEEGIDPRWPNTPVIEIETLQMAP